jgi:6-phosphogluconolactonase (cycloisomerase 2 family)
MPVARGAQILHPIWNRILRSDPSDPITPVVGLAVAAYVAEPLEGRVFLSAGHGNGHGRADSLDVVYVASNNPTPGQNAVLAYHRDPRTGALTPLPGSPFLTGGTGFYNSDERLGPDDSDQELIASPDRKTLFVANQGSDDISVFKIKKDGSLKLIPGGPFNSGGDQPVSLGLTGRTLVVVNRGDQVPGQTAGRPPNYTSFHVSGNGKLEKVSTVNAPPGSSPSQALITPDGEHVFGTNLFARPFPPPPGFPPFLPPFGSELVSLRITRDGRLTPAPGTPQGFPLPAPPFILGVGAHPTRNIVYTGFVAANQLGVYTYNKAGTPTFVRSAPVVGAAICWIEVSEDGKRLYASNSATNSVAVFSLADPLNPVQIQEISLGGPSRPVPQPAPVLFSTTPFQLELSPDDDFLYVLNHETTVDDSFPQGNALHTLRVRPDGTLVEESGPLVFPTSHVPAGAHPLGVLVL